MVLQAYADLSFRFLLNTVQSRSKRRGRTGVFGPGDYARRRYPGFGGRPIYATECHNTHYYNVALFYSASTFCRYYVVLL